MASSGNSCWDSHANSTGNKLHHIHKRFIVNDLEFCNICGTILPIPSHDDYLMCLVCKNNFNVKDWNGKTFNSSYLINQSIDDEEHLKKAHPQHGLTKDDFSGAFVDRKCSKCGHEGMSFSTRQTRSADEGQTVFFACPRCKAQEIEYS